MSLDDWSGLYEDLPSKQFKMPVADASMYQTNHDETKLINPDSLQSEIDRIVAMYPSAGPL